MTLIEVGNDHRLADPEPLAAMLKACNGYQSQSEAIRLQRLRNIHDDLLQSVAAVSNKLGGIGLTTFFPLRGSASKGDLMVVGRSVNGWAAKWMASETLNLEDREKIIRQVFDRCVTADGCSMQWVNDPGNGFNYRMSAFWRVICSVTQSIIAYSEKDWHSKLIWSDLYKVAPHAGGNPGRTLK